MNNFFRALIAGYGAKKLGGGCFSTVLIFIVIWYALGYCGNNSRAATKVSPITNTTQIKYTPPIKNVSPNK
jgi:hypothetical protein